MEDKANRIQLGAPVVNPYMLKFCKEDLARAAGISANQLAGLMDGSLALDVDTYKIVDGEADGNIVTSAIAIDRLLESNSPQSVDVYILRELVAVEDDELKEGYRKIINRAQRCQKLIEVGAPQIVVNSENKMLQDAVERLYFGYAISREAKKQADKCLWDIVSKILNI